MRKNVKDITMNDVTIESIAVRKHSDIEKFMKVNTFNCLKYNVKISPECCLINKANSSKDGMDSLTHKYNCRHCNVYKVSIINTLLGRIAEYYGNEPTQGNIEILKRNLDLDKIFKMFCDFVNETKPVDKVSKKWFSKQVIEENVSRNIQQDDLVGKNADDLVKALKTAEAPVDDGKDIDNVNIKKENNVANKTEECGVMSLAKKNEKLTIFVDKLPSSYSVKGNNIDSIVIKNRDIINKLVKVSKYDMRRVEDELAFIISLYCDTIGKRAGINSMVVEE